MRKLETDYLVIGCGAAGMAFADTLIAHGDADVIMVDRREVPGGHWNDAYPFVRLHQPSSYYGVNSTPLGKDTIQQDGLDKGFYEQATAAELVAYFANVMREVLLASGRVRHYPGCEYLGDHRFASLRTGETFEVTVRRKAVDATYLEPSVPATSPPPFPVEDGARCVPVGDLPAAIGDARAYVVIGGGKTAMDACLWLLQSGVRPEDIRWIKPRDAWLVNRRFVQGRAQVGDMIEGVSLQLEAAAQAHGIEDLFDRLVDCGQWHVHDHRHRPTMYKAAIASAAELDALRRIGDVVRLGRVRRLGRNAIELERGSIPTSADHLHVHCAAIGLNRAPAVPIFTQERITLQPIRTGLIPFNAALVGYVEARRDDLGEKNRLCPPNRLPDAPRDWLRGTLIGTNADYSWSRQPDIASWLEKARLNPMQGLRAKASDPQVQRAMQRYVANVKPALTKLASLA